MLLSSEKFQDKADEVLKEGLETQPINYKSEKIMTGKTDDSVTLDDPTSEEGGMMLYTSGTTSRPVGARNGPNNRNKTLNVHRKACSSPNPS
jgi:acyl-coenzyme A synthetase/AMP-(fatty) acid ligase